MGFSLFPALPNVSLENVTSPGEVAGGEQTKLGELFCLSLLNFQFRHHAWDFQSCLRGLDAQFLFWKLVEVGWFGNFEKISLWMTSLKFDPYGVYVF